MPDYNALAALVKEHGVLYVQPGSGADPENCRVGLHKHGITCYPVVDGGLVLSVKQRTAGSTPAPDVPTKERTDTAPILDAMKARGVVYMAPASVPNLLTWRAALRKHGASVYVMPVGYAVIPTGASRAAALASFDGTFDFAEPVTRDVVDEAALAALVNDLGSAYFPPGALGSREAIRLMAFRCGLASRTALDGSCVLYRKSAT